MKPETSIHRQVTAALIPVEGKLFIAQRPPLKKFGLLWEFPGGKVEADETLEASLMREIEEELCWNIRVGDLFERIEYRQPDLNIDLYAFWCTVKGGMLCLKEHVKYCWASPGELRNFGFTKADFQLVLSIEKLKELPSMQADSKPTSTS
jgi:8-oxo-dGTP diphosphatase